MNKVSRPALRYHGGKWRLAPWVIKHFPAHDVYCEPYGGAASVLLRKPAAKVEVWNDLNEDVVNLFRVLRERPDELVRAIALTPYARAEWERCQEPCDDPVERARRLYVLSQQGLSGAGTRESGGWRWSRNMNGGLVAAWNNIGHLWDIVERLKDIMLECRDAVEVIHRYDGPETLFYVDPPYVRSERSSLRKSATYEYEMWDEDHRALASVLREVEGMVVLSGYQCALYDELYGDWRKVGRMSRKNGGGGYGRERLYLSPATVRALGPLFRLRLG